MRLSKIPLSVLIPAVYGITAIALLNLPLNRWLALQAFYVISWPASHFFAREEPPIETVYGVIQWALIGLLADIVFRRKSKP